MNTILPFELSNAAGGYFLLYGVTLLIHVAFMNYVLAGCGYMALTAFWGPKGERLQTPVTLILRDWMPFALSAAITAGVAPLLFVQILYKKEFYTANLLLGPRVMIMLPALIAAFYLLYVMKSRRMSESAGWQRVAVPGVIFACFLYTAWTWTENHLLSIHGGDWVRQYEAGAWSYSSSLILPRFLLWCFGSIPTLCVLLLWQLQPTSFATQDEANSTYRKLALLACGGMALATGAAAWTCVAMPASMRQAMTAPEVLPYLWVLIGGVLLQVGGWLLGSGRRSLQGRIIVSTGLVATIAGTVILRESVRLEQVGKSALDPLESLADGAEGFWAFLFFFLLNAVLIGWCVGVAKKATPRQVDEAT